MKFGQKKLRHYGLGIKKGVHKVSSIGSKALNIAQFAALAQPELLPEIEISKAIVNGIEKLTK